MTVIESAYPITFRAADAQTLGSHIRHHNSVVLIGMKRVGISNFLRFFLTHPEIQKTYINQGEHIFVFIDLNSLVEKTLYAFWMLTLKRLVDTIENSNFPDEIKQKSHATFTQSIQLGDFFFTLEAVTKLLSLIVSQGKYLSLFFLRFDRLKEAVTPEFFANLLGIKEHVKQLSYIFTSFCPLQDLVPEVFTRSATSGFLHDMYLKPATEQDSRTILSTFQKRYDLPLAEEMQQKLVELAGGHVQYLQLSLTRLKNTTELLSPDQLASLLSQDEEIRLLSEELYSSVSASQQIALDKVKKGKYRESDEIAANYLWETGMLVGQASAPQLFSPLFASYLSDTTKRVKKAEQEFTKKEHLLYTVLKENEGNLVERDTIVNTVWPDEVEFGVSDWSIDRLVARVRRKLRARTPDYKIVTVITRGYKLIKNPR